MNVQEEIVSYLYEYGNTKETDILNYYTQNYSLSKERIKKAIKRMVVKGRIYYVVHTRLKPPEVYISLKEPMPPEISKILIEASMKMKTAKEDSQKILEEAAAVAKKRIGEVL